MRTTPTSSSVTITVSSYAAGTYQCYAFLTNAALPFVRPLRSRHGTRTRATVVATYPRNTLILIGLRRGRELALLRLVGATTRQARSMARGEASLLIVIASASVWRSRPPRCCRSRTRSLEACVRTRPPAASRRSSVSRRSDPGRPGADNAASARHAAGRGDWGASLDQGRSSRTRLEHLGCCWKPWPHERSPPSAHPTYPFDLRGRTSVKLLAWEIRHLPPDEAAALLCVRPDTLRAWEQRFGYPQSVFGGAGERRYAHEDVIALRESLKHELSIASAINRARALAADSQTPSLP